MPGKVQALSHPFCLPFVSLNALDAKKPLSPCSTQAVIAPVEFFFYLDDFVDFVNWKSSVW